MNVKQMVPIPITEFIDGIICPADIFVRLSEEKYVLIAKKNTKPEKERLKAFQGKDLRYLYVHREDLGKFATRNIKIAGIVIGNSSIMDKVKVQALNRAASSVFSEVDKLGFTGEMYEHAKLVTQSTMTLISSRPDLSSLIYSLNLTSEWLVNHSIAVSLFSSMLGRHHDWEKRDTLEKLCLGGMLHDIGMKHLPPELIEKNKADMTFEEISLYETHAFKGLTLLQALHVVPADIISIVYEHHEISGGQGYPRRLRDLKIHPLARVVSMANQFVELILKSPQNRHPLTLEQGLEHIEVVMGQPFNRDAFKALRKLVNSQFANPQRKTG
jgi:HD-GYP domain-containing protein (c-di-GMP phosphodiesterase class II)